jgi:hypothetical protein
MPVCEYLLLLQIESVKFNHLIGSWIIWKSALKIKIPEKRISKITAGSHFQIQTVTIAFHLRLT